LSDGACGRSRNATSRRNAVAQLAAEQLIDGNAQRLPLTSSSAFSIAAIAWAPRRRVTGSTWCEHGIDQLMSIGSMPITLVIGSR